MSDPTSMHPKIQRLKPRPVLFRAMLVVLLLWIGALVWMYFKTVHNVAPPSRNIIIRMPAEESTPATNPR